SMLPAGRQVPPRPIYLLTAVLDFLKEACFYKDNTGLIGEGFEECNLIVGESTRLGARHGDRSDRFVSADHRHGRPASVATETSVGARGFWPSGIGVDVGDIERRSFANDLGVPCGHFVPLTSLRRFGLECLREECPRGSVASAVGSRERGKDDLIANDAGQHARV